METKSMQAELRQKIEQAAQILDSFKWLVDAYVVDFYQDDHWSNLPASWARCFADVPTEKLSDLLCFDRRDSEVTVWPLTIHALRSLFRRLVHIRTIKPTDTLQRETNTDRTDAKHVFHQQAALFQKSVKLKKRHEIEKFVFSCSLEPLRDCNTFVDVGSGQGNLARTLAYGFGFRVCCIEQCDSFVEIARRKDSQLSERLIKQDPNLQKTISHPVHLNEKVNLDEIDAVKFVQMIRDALNVEKEQQSGEDMFSFGLIGLHPCGDLAPSLLRLFLACRECRFVKLVCCCYMKLSSIDSSLNSCTSDYGFPLSVFCRTSQLTLSYQAREIACHAIEQYREKLLVDYNELKVHAYRAAIETIIVRMRPDLKHSGLKGGIKATEATFEEYCHQAVGGLDLIVPYEEIHSKGTRDLLDRWKQVVKFYTLRLMFAPLVETVILYDRLLFLVEKDANARIDVLFDPYISPRNHAITAFKKPHQLARMKD